jgi:hypothetical protein
MHVVIFMVLLLFLSSFILTTRKKTMHMGLKVLKKQGICERIFHFQEIIFLPLHFFVKLFVVPRKDDNNPTVF